MSLELQTKKDKQEGKLIVISGLMKSGKSCLIASELIKHCPRCAYVSLEMSWDTLYDRYSKYIDSIDIYTGACSYDSIEKLVKDYKVICIDHIALMDDFNHKLSRKLKQLTLNNNITLYIVVQLNEKGSTYGTRTIMQDCDQLYRINRKEQTCELAFNRYGPTKTFFCKFDEFWAQCYDIENKYKPFSIIWELQNHKLIENDLRKEKSRNMNINIEIINEKEENNKPGIAIALPIMKGGDC